MWCANPLLLLYLVQCLDPFQSFKYLLELSTIVSELGWTWWRNENGSRCWINDVKSLTLRGARERMREDKLEVSY